MGVLVVITTVGTEEQAVEIAEELLGRRHAACVNILQVPRTIYRWEGKVCRDSELLLMIKTTDEEYDSVEATIKELHDYELPEVLGFQVSRISSDFLPWITAALDKDSEFDEEGDHGEPDATADTD